jgi:hypothetical protein
MLDVLSMSAPRLFQRLELIPTALTVDSDVTPFEPPP